jgi:hypothetical protein
MPVDRRQLAGIMLRNDSAPVSAYTVDGVAGSIARVLTPKDVVGRPVSIALQRAAKLDAATSSAARVAFKDDKV